MLGYYDGCVAVKEEFMTCFSVLLIKDALTQTQQRCNALCVNMFKNCTGRCQKKHDHLTAHQCSCCHWKWDLLPHELEQRVNARMKAKKDGLLQ
jgi:hypothetical protein